MPENGAPDFGALNEELRRQHAINTAVLNATLDGVTLVSADGKVMLVNAAQERLLTDLFELPPAESVDDHLTPVVDQVVDREAFLAFSEDFTEHHDFEGTLDVNLRSGRSYMLYTAPVRAGDDFLGRVFVIRETTAEREAEKVKSELVATVSHELRTPLASILGFAELLTERDYDTETQKRFLHTIRREAKRLTTLVNDFLDLQRIEDASFTLDLRPFELNALVRESVELFRGQSADHVIDLDLTAAPIEAIGEPGRIAQVLANLLSNAIKYSPAGGAVRVKTELLDNAVRVSVADEGVGIPAEQQNSVFDKFFRADSTDTREIGGTGLGLALCREIVNAHGGRIGFDSTEGDGSVFWFELSVAVTGDGGPVPRILIVEDDPEAAALLVNYLSDGDYVVEVTPTAERALARIAADAPDLICLDIKLAGKMDGWTMLTELKGDAETSGIPVVICTSGDGRGRAAALGATDFLSKPFSADELRSTVERYLPPAGGSVLVVDDDKIVRSLVLQALHGNGVELREAADGVQALEEVALRRPDAVVLDLNMPALDGFGVLERLQARPETQDIPVVVLTARLLSESERRQLHERATALLEKNNYTRDRLRRLVYQALGKESLDRGEQVHRAERLGDEQVGANVERH